MVIAIILLILMLSVSAVLNYILLRALGKAADAIMALQNEFDDLQFMEGMLDIPEDEILQKFDDAFLLCQTIPIEGEDVRQIFDTSLYLKNKVIGLTYFVPKQLLENVQQEVTTDARIEEIIRRKLKENDIEVDEETFQIIFQEAKEQLELDDSPPIIPHCTVYQLKNGRWIWRQEDENDKYN